MKAARTNTERNSDSVYFADAKKESAAGSYAESAMTSEGFEVTDEDIPF